MRALQHPIRLALWGLALSALVVFGAWRLLLPPMEASFTDTIGQGDYQLQTTTGEAFTEASLQGSPSAVFFGFTHCPEVCPTTLGDVAKWQDELAERDQALRVFFVTVDPERDTLELLNDYVSWAPGVVGVSGTPAEVEKAISAFRVFSQRIPLDDGDYTMDHSAYVMLFDEKGRLFEPVGYREDPARVAAKLERLFQG